MPKSTILFAKLAGLYKSLQSYCSEVKRVAIPVDIGTEFYNRYTILANELRAELPDLYSDLPVRATPNPGKRVSQGATLFSKSQITLLLNDMEYIFELRANSELSSEATSIRPNRVFISHGRSGDWREVQAYVEKDAELDTLELAQEPNRGRTVLQKLNEESERCSFAVVVMTGDDHADSSRPQVRENVMHEIGFFQGKFGLANVCLLHEEGTNIPTNISGVVYIPFPKGLVSASFGVLMRELKATFQFDFQS